MATPQQGFSASFYKLRYSGTSALGYLYSGDTSGTQTLVAEKCLYI